MILSVESGPKRAFLFDKDRTLLLPNPPGREWRRAGYIKRGYFNPPVEGEVLSIMGDTLWYDESLLRAGTLAFLRFLRARDIPCGIVTLDYEDAAKEWLEAAGLTDYFQQNAIIGEDSLDFRDQKPKPGHFLMAADRLGIDPANCVMVGDDLYDDIEGAKEAGMRTVLVKYHRYKRDVLREVRPDLIVNNFFELNERRVGRLFRKPHFV